MSEEELKDFYGDELGDQYAFGDDGYYYLLKTSDNVSIMFVINMEGNIEQISVSTDYMKY